jgi:DNA transformation protein
MSQEFAAFVVEQMRGFGPVQAKRMFGGHGLFREGLMFALILADTLYFKTDDATRSRFTERGLQPFTYEARGRRMSLSYWQAPGEVLDDAGAMVDWTRLAFACALRKHKATPAPRKAAVRKAPTQAASGKKAPAKEAPATEVGAKQALVKEAAAKKVPREKAPAKKAAVKKAAAKKTPPKEAAARGE